MAPSNDDDGYDIAREENAGRGRYVMYVGAEQVTLTYFRAAERVMAIDHTYTPPGLRGRGLAKVLVERAIADARAASEKVDPICPYVAVLFDRTPEWADLRA